VKFRYGPPLSFQSKQVHGSPPEVSPKSKKEVEFYLRHMPKPKLVFHVSTGKPVIKNVVTEVFRNSEELWNFKLERGSKIAHTHTHAPPPPN
jgi:hypothetical protein